MGKRYFGYSLNVLTNLSEFQIIYLLTYISTNTNFYCRGNRRTAFRYWSRSIISAPSQQCPRTIGGRQYWSRSYYHQNAGLFYSKTAIRSTDSWSWHRIVFCMQKVPIGIHGRISIINSSEAVFWGWPREQSRCLSYCSNSLRVQSLSDNHHWEI